MILQNSDKSCGTVVDYFKFNQVTAPKAISNPDNNPSVLEKMNTTTDTGYVVVDLWMFSFLTLSESRILNNLRSQRGNSRQWQSCLRGTCSQSVCQTDLDQPGLKRITVIDSIDGIMSLDLRKKPHSGIFGNSHVLQAQVKKHYVDSEACDLSESCRALEVRSFLDCSLQSEIKMTELCVLHQGKGRSVPSDSLWVSEERISHPYSSSYTTAHSSGQNPELKVSVWHVQSAGQSVLWFGPQHTQGSMLLEISVVGKPPVWHIWHPRERLRMAIVVWAKTMASAAESEVS